MSWIGLRDRHIGTFGSGGLAAPGAGLLTRGSLQIECAFTPGPMASPLIHYCTMTPWPVRLTLALTPDGAVNLGHRVGARTVSARLTTGLRGPTTGLRVTYGWDAPGRIGWLSLFDPSAGRLWHRRVAEPMPLDLRDAKRLVTDPGGMRLGPDADWMGLADHLVPIGPMPGIDGAAQLTLADGSSERADAVAPGTRLRTANGGTATVLWSGSAETPARGALAPLCLRAPYHGLTRDIAVATHQRIHLAGSEVDYLFGVEEVTAAAGHLADERSVLPITGEVIRTWWQVLLDRPAAILANGCALASIDPGGLVSDPDGRALSVLADLPGELVPRAALGAGPAPALKRYEAMTLAYSGNASGAA